MIKKIEIGDEDSPEYDYIRELLLEYKQVFTKKQNQGIEGMEHRLELTDDTPIRQRPNKTDVHSQTIIDKTINDLLEQGIIEEAEGDWCSPVLLVKKKDSQMKLVVD